MPHHVDRLGIFLSDDPQLHVAGFGQREVEADDFAVVLIASFGVVAPHLSGERGFRQAGADGGGDIFWR